jgi:extracellular elastinolytic metalloproteinase
MQFSDEQTPLGGHRDSEGHLVHMHQSNCRFHNLADELSASSTSEDVTDFRPALLQFMVAATPNDEVVNSILGNFDAHIDKMNISPTSDFAPSGETIEFMVDQVPDAVNPVKAKMAYIQVPSKKGDTTHLNLVWKVCQLRLLIETYVNPFL